MKLCQRQACYDLVAERAEVWKVTDLLRKVGKETCAWSEGGEVWAFDAGGGLMSWWL